MPRDPRTYLWDAITAADLLASFAAGKTFVHYEADALGAPRDSQPPAGGASPSFFGKRPTGQETPVPLSGQ